MNIACISHYSPLLNNSSNSWMRDFYSSINDIDEINFVYFFYIRFTNKNKITINKTTLSEKIIDISIQIPIHYKFLRLINILDEKFTQVITNEIRSYLNKHHIKINFVHVNTLYYAFIIEAFENQAGSTERVIYLHLHENKNLLQKLLDRNKYSSIKYIKEYDYVIRQTPVAIDNLIKINSSMLYLPNSFDDSYFNFKYKKKITTTGITILSIGYLRKTKNYKKTIDVIKILVDRDYDVKLNIVGSGPELSRLMKYVKRKKLENNVKFLGYQIKGSINALLSDCDLLLNTSDFESFGNVFLESLATGTPIVTCAKGGPEYLFRWAYNNSIYIGEYTYSAQTEELSEAVIKVLKRKDCDMYKTSSLVRTEFSSEKFLKTLFKKEGYSKTDWWKNNE